jgi:histidine triad (HIT) family protein
MVGQLNGAAAGQTVFHLHFHVIPRYEAAPFTFHGQSVADPAELARHADAIRAALD